MSTVKQVVGAASALTVTGLSTLAATNYATSNAVNNTTNGPLDLLVELSVAASAVGGNKQAVLFALASIDGTNFQTGNNSTDEADMTLIGVLPLNSTTTQRRQFSVAMAYGGVLPPYLKFVVKNDTGAGFTSGGLALSEVSGTVV